MTTDEGKGGFSYVGSLKLSDDQLAEVLEVDQDLARPKRISLDNGRTWATLDQALDVINHPDKYKADCCIDWDTLAAWMDKRVKEETHRAFDPCDKATFLEAYIARLLRISSYPAH